MEKVVQIDLLVLKIFSKLKTKDLISCSQVNTLWRAISEVEFLWYTIDLSTCTGPLRSLESLIIGHPQVRSLILKESTITDPPYWEHNFAQNEVQKINLSEAFINYIGFKIILKHTPRLKVLNIRGCNFMTTCSKGISYLKKRREEVLEGTQPRIAKTPPAAMTFVFMYSRELEEVDFGDIDAPFIIEWPFERIETLRRLRFHCRIPTDNALIKAVEKYPNLTHLDVTVTPTYPSGIVEEIEDTVRRHFPAITINIKAEAI